MLRILSLLCSLMFSCSLITHAQDIEKIDLNLVGNEIAFTFFELKSGEATLIQNGAGETILVNTGGPLSEKQLKQRLLIYNIRKIDHIIITNIGSDYCANLSWLVKEYNVKSVIAGDSVQNVLSKRFELSDVKGWKKGFKSNLISGLHVDVIYSEQLSELNKGALALLFTFGQQKMLYMGIADLKVEERLASEYELDAQILKVGDFASEKGTSQMFIDEVDPQIAVIFKTYDRNPSTDVLDRLHETWIDTYLTVQSGNISIKSSGEQYKVITIRNRDIKKKDIEG